MANLLLCACSKSYDILLGVSLLSVFPGFCSVCDGSQAEPEFGAVYLSSWRSHERG